MKHFKKGDILPTTAVNLSFRVLGWDSKTKNDCSDILRYPREVLGETEVDGLTYIHIDDIGYTGANPYIIEENELMRVFGIEESNTVTLKEDILSLTIGTVSDSLKEGKYNFGDISFTEKYITENPSIFKVNSNKLSIGDYIQLLNVEGVCEGVIGEVGIVTGLPINDDVYATNLKHIHFYRHNLRKLSKVEFLAATTIKIEGYTAEASPEGIKFGCNTHSIQDLNSYMHFLDANTTATMTVHDVNITPKLLKKLINLHKNQ